MIDRSLPSFPLGLIPRSVLRLYAFRLIAVLAGCAWIFTPVVRAVETTSAPNMSPRFLATTTVVASNEDGIGWGESPSFVLTFSNPSKQDMGSLNCRVSAVDALTGKSVWSKDVDFSPTPAGGHTKIPLKPELANGAYELKWKTSDSQGELPKGAGVLRIARMMGNVSKLSEGSALRTYARRWGLPGGVFWQCTPKRAAATGAVWERHWTPWSEIERKEGEFDFSAAVQKVMNAKQAGLDIIYFNTIYEQPPFYKADRASFAAAYGRLHRELAKALGENVRWYEFGNEDNGPSKYLYTEIARNGSAGVRSENPEAMLGNSGTAMIDIGWLSAQSKRGLFDRLDALITHPYSWTSSPEDYGMLEQLEGVDTLIDKLGGMKFQLSTEFGYSHHLFDQQKRAEWIPRHFAIGFAAGLHRHGLYAWDGHFGIYDNGRAFPAAVSTNAFCNLTRAHRFDGWLRKDKQVWAALFERVGKPLLMAWSPSENGTLTVEGATSATQVWDLNGNLMPTPFSNNSLVLNLSGAPVYVTGLSSQTLRNALQNAASAQRERYARVLASSPIRDEAPWKEMAEIDCLSMATGMDAVMKWKPSSGSISLAEQAVLAQTIRRLILATHLQSLNEAEQKSGWSDAHVVLRQQWSKHLADSVHNDVDLPSLRWVLEIWDQVRGEAVMSHEEGNDQLATLLTSLEPVFGHLCGVLSENGNKVFFPIWPYVYSSGKAGAPLEEHIKFAPEKAVPVKVRLNSYASRAYEAEVKLEVPGDWRVDPKVWQGPIKPGEMIETQFLVTAGSTIPKELFATLSVPDKPPVRLLYNDFEVLPSVEFSVPVLSSLLPQTPLPFQITNNGNHEQGVKLRFMEHSGDVPFAVMQIDALKPGESRKSEVQVPLDSPVPAFNEWRMAVHYTTTQGKENEFSLPIDFSAAVFAASPPAIDGNMQDWKMAAPLHLDKEAYTHGSFARGWSLEDLSGVAYTMWDAQCFYLAVRVTDQLFQQALENDAVWAEDSIQFALATEGGQMVEFSLSQTPNGPQVWSYQSNKLVKNAKLSVKIEPGATLYECAIPWSEMPGIPSAAGEKCRFDILLNDSDAIGGRKVLERYGNAIVNTKDINGMGYLHFLAPAEQTPPDISLAKTPSQRVFVEDFQEYGDGQVPDVWKRVIHDGPVPNSVVRAGTGRQGSNALELNNPLGSRPFVYLMLVRKLNGLETGKRYVLSAWVKGETVESPGSILGICSDVYGNESTQMISAWKASSDWQQIKMEFEAPAGGLNVIIKNSDGVIKDFLIDDIEVVGLNESSR